MRKIGYLILVLAAALSMSSCRKAVEKARKNIRIEAVEKIERHGLTGAEVVVRVMNNTGYKLSLENVLVNIYYAGTCVGDIRLREGVSVDRRTTQSVSTQWQLRISDPLALYVMSRKLGEGDISQIAVSYTVEGRGGPAGVNFSREMIPLSEFLNTFGVTLDDVKNYLNR